MMIKRTVVWFVVFCVVVVGGMSAGVQVGGGEQKGKELLKKGDIEINIGEFENALLLLSHALELLNNKSDIVSCKMKLGLIYWNIGKLQKSVEFYNEAYSDAKNLKLKEKYEECLIALEINRLYRKGKALYKQRSFINASKCFEEAIKSAEIIGSEAYILKCKRLLSVVYYEISDFENFFLLNQEALKLAQNLKHKKEIGDALNHLGLYYSMRCNYSHALVNYLEALKIFRDLKYDESISACLNNLATIHKYLGSLQKALEYQTDALKIDRKLGNKVYISMDLNNLGEIYRKKAMVEGDKTILYKSLMNFIDCLNIVQEIGENNTEIQVMNNIGNVYIYLKKYHKALLYLLMGLNKVNKHKNKESECMLLTNIGIVYSKLNRNFESEECFLKAIKIGERIRANHILWETYFELGQNFERMKEYFQAASYYEKAIDVIDHIRDHILLDVNKAGFSERKLKVYERLIKVYYYFYLRNSEKEYVKKIYSVIERAKTRTLIEVLRESRINISDMFDMNFKYQEIILSQKIALCLQQLINNEIPEFKRKMIEIELFELENEYRDLISKIKIFYPEVVNLISPGLSDIENIQNQLLDDETAIIEYFLGEKQSYLVVILNSKYEVFELPPKIKIQNSIRAYLRALETPSRKNFRGILASMRIYRELFAHIDGFMPETINRLVIVPDGILHYLPFEALVIPSSFKSNNRNYLITKYSISYSPSVSSLLLISKQKNKNHFEKEILMIGNPDYQTKSILSKDQKRVKGTSLKNIYKLQGYDLKPLPFSAREVKVISSYFQKENKKILINNQANESNVKNELLKEYRIIHFACHALLDEIIPYQSALVLSQNKDGEEDGLLHVGEISTLRVRAELIVLSACQTGKGKIATGEGVLGLPRIFFYIGAKSIISTLWKIQDKPTVMFMGYFYYYLSKGVSLAQALRLAKLDMIKSKFSHPFYWAGFVISGKCDYPLLSLASN